MDYHHKNVINTQFGRHLGVVIIRTIKEQGSVEVILNHKQELELSNYKKWLENYSGFDTSTEFDHLCLSYFDKSIHNIDWPYGNFFSLNRPQQKVPIFLVKMFNSLNL